ncbi:uncharacterized protein CMU_008730 [Cryptosporidium muris RN66]|uniref:Uncharacterized protein n=1 Tax=Cryptosporidium muris (strain RN66) TaxID=441375 RepID=B6ADU1_CRYMR|nr:uncharacterized protein CMU_008730 [Cryptosporidium muris RN66]EEA06382.1 hypothetical protein CMU_008730 [Cryptosporidium muris RN66]|eukprot:XP_002140731.1 hypothetical protein [Cryptosporidium muris RN66]
MLNKTFKRRIADVLDRLNNCELLQNSAIITLGQNLEELENSPNESEEIILTELLVSIVMESDLECNISLLKEFISEIPVINISPRIRLKAVKTLLKFNRYKALNIFRRLSSITTNNSKRLPIVVIRPLLKYILCNERDIGEIPSIQELISFFLKNSHCICTLLDICFENKKFELLIKLLSDLLPLIKLPFLSDVFNLICSKVVSKVKFETSFSPKKVQDLSFYSLIGAENNQIACLIIIMIINCRKSTSLYLLLMTTVLNIKGSINLTLLLFLSLLSSYKLYLEDSNFKKDELEKSDDPEYETLTDPLQLIQLLVQLAEDIEPLLSDSKNHLIVSSIISSISLLIYYCSDIEYLDCLVNIIIKLKSVMAPQDHVSIYASLLYHTKGGLAPNEPLAIFSLDSIKKLGYNEIPDEVYGYSFNISDFITSIKGLILVIDDENLILSVFSHILIGLYPGFLLIISISLLNINYIYTDINLIRNLAVMTNFLLGIPRNKKNSKINNDIYIKIMYKYIYTIGLNNPLQTLDSFYPNLMKLQDVQPNVAKEQCHLLCTLATNKYTIPIIYKHIIKISSDNELETFNQPSEIKLESLYQSLRFLFEMYINGELPFSKLDTILCKCTEKEKLGIIAPSQFIGNFESNISFPFGYLILYNIIRYKPDIIDEYHISIIQEGLLSCDPSLVTISIHCLTELCKAEIMDFEKCLMIIIKHHPLLFETKLELPHFVTPISYNKVSHYQYIVPTISSFARFVKFYILKMFPKDSTSIISNTLYYTIPAMVQICNEKIPLLSCYCFEALSPIFLQYFQDYQDLNSNLSSFIDWVMSSFNRNLTLFEEFLQYIFDSISYNIDIEPFSINSLNFIISTLTYPILSILNQQGTRTVGTTQNSASQSSNSRYLNNFWLKSLTTIKSKYNHQSIQELLNLIVFDPKSVRIEVFKNNNLDDFKKFQQIFIREIIRTVKSLKLISSNILRLRYIYFFSDLFSKYFKQIEFIHNHILKRQNTKNSTTNRTTKKISNSKGSSSLDSFLTSPFLSDTPLKDIFINESLYLFYIMASYLPFEENSENSNFFDLDLINKIISDKSNDLLLKEEIFIDSQCFLVYAIVGLAICIPQISDLVSNFFSILLKLETLPFKIFSYVVSGTFILHKICCLGPIRLNMTSELEDIIYLGLIPIPKYSSRLYPTEDLIDLSLIVMNQGIILNNMESEYNQVNEWKSILDQYLKIEMGDSQSLTKSRVFSWTFGISTIIETMSNTLPTKENLQHLLNIYRIFKGKKSLNFNLDREVYPLILECLLTVSLYKHNLVTIEELWNLTVYWEKNYESYSNNLSGLKEVDKSNLWISIDVFAICYLHYIARHSNESCSKNLSKSWIKPLIKQVIATNISWDDDSLVFIFSAIFIYHDIVILPWKLSFNRDLDMISNLTSSIVNSSELLEIFEFLYHQIVDTNQFLAKSQRKNSKLSSLNSFEQFILSLSDPTKATNLILLSSFVFIDSMNFLNFNESSSSSLTSPSSLLFYLLQRVNNILSGWRKNIHLSPFCVSSILFGSNENIRDILSLGIILKAIKYSSSLNCINFNLSGIIHFLLFDCVMPLISSQFLENQGLLEIDRMKVVLEWFWIIFTDFMTVYLVNEPFISQSLTRFGYQLFNTGLYSRSNHSFWNILIISYLRLVQCIFITMSEITTLNDFMSFLFMALTESNSQETSVLNHNSGLFLNCLLVNIKQIFNIYQNNINNTQSHTQFPDFSYSQLQSISIKTQRIIIPLFKYYLVPKMYDFPFSVTISTTLLIKSILSSFVRSDYRDLNTSKESIKGNIMNLIKSLPPLCIGWLVIHEGVPIEFLHLRTRLYIEYAEDIINSEHIRDIVHTAFCYFQYTIFKEGDLVTSNRENSEYILKYLSSLIKIEKYSCSSILLLLYTLAFMFIPDLSYLLYEVYIEDKGNFTNKTKNLIKSTEWHDIRNFSLLDSVDHPSFKNPDDIFIDNKGIQFLSYHYDEIKANFFSIDTNFLSIQSSFTGDTCYIPWNIYKPSPIFYNINLFFKKEDYFSSLNNYREDIRIWRRLLPYRFSNNLKNISQINNSKYSNLINKIEDLEIVKLILPIILAFIDNMYSPSLISNDSFINLDLIKTFKYSIQKLHFITNR